VLRLAIEGAADEDGTGAAHGEARQVGRKVLIPVR
jgi:hypothetical protein